MPRVLAILTAAIFLVLHQDFWFWRTPYPMLFGFLPIGLAYHAMYALGAALLMAILVKIAWPAHLENEVEGDRS